MSVTAFLHGVNFKLIGFGRVEKVVEVVKVVV